MKRMLVALRSYVQGPGIMPEIGEHVALLGDNAVVVGGNTALKNTRDAISKSLAEHKIKYVFELFMGETTLQEIERLENFASTQKANLIIGVGGGKVIDTVKVVADDLNIPVALVPTVVASDAPCSALSIIYKEDGTIEQFLTLREHPALVFVDTQIIARAPVRFLVAGMGDALSTRFEADACFSSGAKNFIGTYTTSAALAIARLCYDSLINYGYLAKMAVENKTAVPALEKVVEAVILHSGLGFENVGVAAAHAIQDGFVTLEDTSGFLHGEKVAFCTLVQLVLENRGVDLLNEVYGFCHSVGLPITLAEIGVSSSDRDKLLQVARVAMESPLKMMENLPFPVTAHDIYDAILFADALGNLFHSRQAINEHASVNPRLETGNQL